MLATVLARVLTVLVNCCISLFSSWTSPGVCAAGVVAEGEGVVGKET